MAEQTEPDLDSVIERLLEGIPNLSSTPFSYLTYMHQYEVVDQENKSN